MPPVRNFAFPGKADEAPRCALTLAAAGAMKLGRDEENRSRVFRSAGIAASAVLSLTQVHSRIVRIAENPGVFDGHPDGDGILTRNRELVPCVTVADCMPVYVFDPVSGCFGVLHSGWRGTGIIGSALGLAAAEWGAEARNFRVVLGPHIRSCCYTVDRERARYFIDAFGPSCVAEDAERAAAGNPWPYRLSLAEANRRLCLSLGILPENIFDTGECTACKCEYGSNRREGAGSFTHMAAFISWH